MQHRATQMTREQSLAPKTTTRTSFNRICSSKNALEQLCVASRNFTYFWLPGVPKACPVRPPLTYLVILFVIISTSSSRTSSALIMVRSQVPIRLPFPPNLTPISASKTPRSCSSAGSNQGKAAPAIRARKREPHQRSHRVRNQRGFFPLRQFGKGTTFPVTTASAHCSRRPRILAERTARPARCRGPRR